MPPIVDHPLRYGLANELHARPFPTAQAPSTVAFMAIKPDEAAPGPDADRARLIALLDRHGAPHPQPGATHYSGQIGRHMLKWERHTEFVTYTALGEGIGPRPFDADDFAVFPDDWLTEETGTRITSATIRIEPRPSDQVVQKCLGDWFVPESLAVATVLDEAAVIAGDFRIDPAGHMRFAVFVGPDTGRRRVGRVVQRLCEIETYKAMAMLGFALARDLSPRVNDLDRRLTGLMAGMAEGTAEAEDTLTRLLGVSAELEASAAQAAYRFAATGAYEAIVNQRIEILREERFQGRQTFREFMMRRFEPAMRTANASERRLARLADRAMRAGELLRTQVDVARSAQNQELLESMDRRADLALRLQNTVEGLSVVAISYYAVSLGGYLLAPFADPLGMSKGALTAAITLPVILAVWWSIRRIRARLH